MERIKILSEQNEDENWEFRRFLKFYDTPGEDIDTIVHRIYREIAARIDCTECGNCCEIVSPALDQKDIEKLSEALEMSPDEFVIRYLGERDDEGKLEMRDRPCPFLEGSVCSCYDARPEACVSYPHLQKEGFVSRLMNVIANCSVCPIVFNVYEELKRELRFR